MEHKMKLHNEPFNMIKAGTKTVEMRLNDEKRRIIMPNDIIIFTNTKTNEELKVIVLDRKVFDNFELLYNHYDKISIGYKEDEESNPKDMEMYYSEEKIKKYKVLAIEVKLYE